MTDPILRITEATVAGPASLRLSFNDGATKVVDVTPLLKGPVFEPLRNPEYFAQVNLDEVCGTVVWPNGADFAPEALHGLSSHRTPCTLTPEPRPSRRRFRTPDNASPSFP